MHPGNLEGAPHQVDQGGWKGPAEPTNQRLPFRFPPARGSLLLDLLVDQSEFLGGVRVALGSLKTKGLAPRF